MMPLDIADLDDNGHYHDFSSPCSVYSIDSIGPQLVKNEHQLALFHHNIRSFNKNYDELSVLLNTFVFTMDIIVLTETWFSPVMSFDIEGYTGHHSFRCNQRGGGVSIFVRECFSVTSIAALQLNSDVLECCAVKLSLSPSSSSYVVGIYRPPNPATVVNFNSVLSDFLSNHFRSVDKVIFAGDFNIDIIDPNDAALSLIDNFHSHSFIPLITKPTHVTNIRASLIDHVWTNILSPISSGIVDVDITDHLQVFFLFYDLPSHKEPIFFFSRSFDS